MYSDLYISLQICIYIFYRKCPLFIFRLVPVERRNEISFRWDPFKKIQKTCNLIDLNYYKSCSLEFICVKRNNSIVISEVARFPLFFCHYLLVKYEILYTGLSNWTKGYITLWCLCLCVIKFWMQETLTVTWYTTFEYKLIKLVKCKLCNSFKPSWMVKRCNTKLEIILTSRLTSQRRLIYQLKILI